MKTLKFLFLIVLMFTFSLSAAWAGPLQLSPYNQKHIPAYSSDEPLRFQKVDFISPWKGKNPKKIISYLENLLEQGLIDQATQEFIALFQQNMNMAIQSEKLQQLRWETMVYP